MSYGLKLANPKEFFAESHRPSHFLEFSKLEVCHRLRSVDTEPHPICVNTLLCPE